MRALRKLQLLLGLLPNNPVEFRDRLRTVLEVKAEHLLTEPPSYNPVSLDEALRLLQKLLPADSSEILSESVFLNTRQRVLKDIGDLKSKGPFTPAHNADLSMADFSYLICRFLKPSVVLETGVAYGVTSAFVLQALAVNGKGELWSVDLPPLGLEADRYVGALIPTELRNHWHLRRGPSKRLLPKLLPTLGPLDLFIHDSLHTYRNMRWEFEMIWPLLRPGGVLIADDVPNNRAFHEFSGRVDASFRSVVREKTKDTAFGVLIKRA